VSAPSSLSSDAKDALARTPVEAAHCRAALREGLATYGTAPGRRVFRTQRPAIARLLWALLGDRGRGPVRRVPGRRLRKLPTYEIDLPDEPAASKPATRCDRRMELRAAFLASGSLAAPARGYHLEFVPPDDAATRRLEGLLRSEGLRPRTSRRKGRTVLYFKDVDHITLFLAAIGAAQAMFALEDLRALKETKNRIHRLVNSEAANVDRAAGAAAAQRKRIELIADAYGLRNLSPVLREVAELRLAHPSDTLAELGRRCVPEIKKSTVNSRMAALLRLAKTLET